MVEEAIVIEERSRRVVVPGGAKVAIGHMLGAALSAGLQSRG